MDIGDFLRDELDITEALDIANVDDMYNEGEREIEVFCSWEGTVFNINYPTKLHAPAREGSAFVVCL